MGQPEGNETGAEHKGCKAFQQREQILGWRESTGSKEGMIKRETEKQVCETKA